MTNNENTATWDVAVEKNGFGSFTRLVCSNCMNWRAQAPLYYCAYCGKKMSNPNIDQELIDKASAIGGSEKNG